MTDWADEIARNAVEKWTPHWEFEVEYRVATALRKARNAALEEAAKVCEGPATGDVMHTTEEDRVRFELADAIRDLKDKT
jgi:hypothetical protein